MPRSLLAVRAHQGPSGQRSCRTSAPCSLQACSTRLCQDQQACVRMCLDAWCQSSRSMTGHATCPMLYALLQNCHFIKHEVHSRMLCILRIRILCVCIYVCVLYVYTFLCRCTQRILCACILCVRTYVHASCVCAHMCMHPVCLHICACILCACILCMSTLCVYPCVSYLCVCIPIYICANCCHCAYLSRVPCILGVCTPLPLSLPL